jgi:hypothetical protein
MRESAGGEISGGCGAGLICKMVSAVRSLPPMKRAGTGRWKCRCTKLRGSLFLAMSGAMAAWLVRPPSAGQGS